MEISIVLSDMKKFTHLFEGNTDCIQNLECVIYIVFK